MAEKTQCASNFRPVEKKSSQDSAKRPSNFRQVPDITEKMDEEKRKIKKAE